MRCNQEQQMYSGGLLSGHPHLNLTTPANLAEKPPTKVVADAQTKGNNRKNTASVTDQSINKLLNKIMVLYAMNIKSQENPFDRALRILHDIILTSSNNLSQSKLFWLNIMSFLVLQIIEIVENQITPILSRVLLLLETKFFNRDK
jgi:hypothetical protein